jgi:pullulanase-type alpha-1,6-glucosidase
MRTASTGAIIMAAMLVAAGSAVADETTFTFVPPEGWAVESVSLRGSMNGWGETAMEAGDDGNWSVTVELEPGEYEYKFFINGEWPQDMETWLDGFPVDETAEGYTDDGHGGQNAIRVVGAGGGAHSVAKETFPPAPELQDGFARIHYHRPKGGYGGWGLHAWKDITATVEWTSALPPTGQDDTGLYWDLELKENAAEVGFIVHKGDTKDPGPDMFLNLEQMGHEVWIVSGNTVIMSEPPDVEALALGDLSRQRAYWADARTLAMRVRKTEGNVYTLHSSNAGALELTTDGVVGGDDVALMVAEGLPEAVTDKFPHLKGYTALAIGEADLERVPALLKGQLAVSVKNADGKLIDATGVQIPGVLDDLFAYDGPLGVMWTDGVPSITVWAPTAQNVALHLFDGPGDMEPSAVIDMTEDSGVWSATGDPTWKNKFYLYGVTVFVPRTGMVELNMVTDPYSRSLSMDSRRSQLVALFDDELKPEGWDDLEKPALEAVEDIVIYELHVRDFSASDPTCPPDYVGTYMAFASETNGARHLEALAEAGLTHIHLLPAFDIASVIEDKSAWLDPGDLSQYPADSDRQQAAIAGISGQDPYNWGYDPFHYGVPEGSYSTDPDGSTRILEFREMVKALSDMGLRVVMDVVYNHTHASGVSDKSVLDKVVPGYYHRLNRDGFVETSTCCQNTATEHYMMRRLMVDDVVHWAKDFKVDGFRFDLMGHHMVADMEAVRDALHALTLEDDGVDGEKLYVYGEGWDFGEVQGGKRGKNATQHNMANTGIGCFNDRIRDAIRGGSAFSDRREQGFATGMFLDPNGFNQGTGPDRGTLMNQADRIRIGLAGNLAAYRFVDHTGREMRGKMFENVGFAAQPRETINYCSAHDNETFFDKIQYSAAPSATMADRVRMQNMGLSLVALGQGIPFFHAGSDMLRSKSMEADSYNAGDWFNKLDWTYESNNFGVGLPSAEKNHDRWNIIRPLLAREDITPGRTEIMAAVHHFREMLSIRKSSPLFRLRSAEDIMARVRFLNMGPDQIPGLIVMEIVDELDGSRPIDPAYRRVVAVFNASPEPVEFDEESLKGVNLELHPVQLVSHDEVAKQSSYEVQTTRFSVPARTTAVFVERQ